MLWGSLSPGRCLGKRPPSSGAGQGDESMPASPGSHLLGDGHRLPAQRTMAGSGPSALSLGDVTSIRAAALSRGQQTHTHTKGPALKSRAGACLRPAGCPEQTGGLRPLRAEGRGCHFPTPSAAQISLGLGHGQGNFLRAAAFSWMLGDLALREAPWGHSRSAAGGASQGAQPPTASSPSRERN